MCRFDRYVLGQLMALFGFFSLVLVMIYWINRAVVLFDQLIADGQSAATFLVFTALALPKVIAMALPLAAFAAAVHVTNRLTTESELVVAQASGISPWRLAQPVLAFGLIVAALMALLVHGLMPAAHAELEEREAEIRANVTARMLTEGRFVHPAAGVTVYIREISPEGELRDIFLSDDRTAGNRTTYMAARAYLVRAPDGPRLVMLDGTAHTLEERSARLTVTTYDRFAYDVAALIEQDGRTRRDLREFGTLALLFPGAAALEASGKDAERMRHEGHLRLMEPFLPLVAALLGFSALRLGGFSRFGVWRQIGLAVFLIISVEVVANATVDLARRDPALWPIVYLPLAFGFSAAAALLWLAGRPALFRRRPRAQAPA